MHPVQLLAINVKSKQSMNLKDLPVSRADTSPGQFLGALEAHRLWQLNLQSSKGNN